MEILTAKTAGFCFGVQRAVDRVYEILEETDEPIYTLGPIIHNEEVVSNLEKRGVHAISEEDIPKLKKGRIIIRSHGVGRKVCEKIHRLGLSYEDMTCPFVKKIHRIVEKAGEEGNMVLILGDRTHPEVLGICGWCQGPFQVIASCREAEDFSLPENQNVTVVSQTTFNYNKFKDIVEILQKKSYDVNVLDRPNCYSILNTICSATQERQTEARQIAAAVDTMLVIGGKHSSNTQKLFEICKSECENTYYIQTPVDLDSDMFQRSSFVGITAGASTPKRIIEEVQRHVRKNF